MMMTLRAAPAALFLFFVSISQPSASTSSTAKFKNTGPKVRQVAGEYLVKIRWGTEVSEKQREHLSEILQSEIKTVHQVGRWVSVRRPSMERSDYSLRTLKEKAIVEYVEPNFIYSASVTPNDSLYEKLWGLQNHGQVDSAGHAGVLGIDVGAEAAWDITTGTKQTLVAIIDTGIDFNHPDLSQNIWVNDIEKNGVIGVDDDANGYVDDVYGMNFVDANAPTPLPMDDHGHGSHCAGVIGASGNDGAGIVGLNWNVRMMAVKFLDSEGQGSLEGAILAVDYATKMGAKILSNSWGGGGFSQALKEAIERSESAGALFVAAAGNDSNNNDFGATYPATYPVASILSVAAVDNTGTLAGFSNFGRRTVHVAAPGVNIFSSIFNGQYASWSGTSMATPHVSGVAALMLSANPNQTAVQLKEQIIQTVHPLSQLKAKVKSGGLVNAYAALTNYVTPPNMNEPEHWARTPIQISTAHPYAKGVSEEFEVELPGANEISLYFERFETEKNFDKVFLYDRAGVLITSLSGLEDDSYSVPIRGNYVKVVFSTDDTVEKYGFDITAISYR